MNVYALHPANNVCKFVTCMSTSSVDISGLSAMFFDDCRPNMDQLQL